MEQLINIRAVKDALDRWLMENGESATPTLDALDITLPPNSENFTIGVSKYSNVGIYASTSNNTMEDNRFVIRYFATCVYPEYVRKIVCVGEGDAGEKICKDIGGTGEHNYKFISGQKAYYLN
ncbi:MAG: hypothetical protein IKN49_04650 [Elusimicrobiaceae bacterium]|nr:hypothetical protein [Elusimicrobiaceae bacterium]